MLPMQKDSAVHRRLLGSHRRRRDIKGRLRAAGVDLLQVYGEEQAVQLGGMMKPIKCIKCKQPMKHLGAGLHYCMACKIGCDTESKFDDNLMEVRRIMVKKRKTVNLNKMARRITLREKGKVSLPIGQVKEVMRLLLEELATLKENEILNTVRRYSYKKK